MDPLVHEIHSTPFLVFFLKSHNAWKGKMNKKCHYSRFSLCVCVYHCRKGVPFLTRIKCQLGFSNTSRKRSRPIGGNRTQEGPLIVCLYRLHVHVKILVVHAHCISPGCPFLPPFTSPTGLWRLSYTRVVNVTGSLQRTGSW